MPMSSCSEKEREFYLNFREFCHRSALLYPHVKNNSNSPNTASVGGLAQIKNMKIYERVDLLK